MSKKHLFLPVLSFFLTITLFAQKRTEQLLKVVPPSPTVASLGKYGEVPVSFYTGVPNISIPLYQIKDGDIDLPVSLSYHAGGIRVEEIASPVGLSWALNAGGIVGRNVRGVPDDISNWSQQGVANSIENIMKAGDGKQIEQLATDVDRGLRDGEGDLYYYNFGEFSGKFFYDQSGMVHTVPARNIIINQDGNSWKIVVEDGTAYTFARVEQVSSANCSTDDQSIFSTWFLTSLKSADGQREITLEYDKVNYTYETLTGQTKYFASDGTGSLCIQNKPPCLGTQSYNTHRLAKINFRDGFIKFIYNNTRCDLMMDKSLDEIDVFTKSDILIKRFRLGYSYFGNNSDGCNLLTQNFKRLKLVSLTEETMDLQKPPYYFEYNESVQLPHRMSYSQDHWGYYNGKPNNDLIASFTTTLTSGQQYTFQGADRRANPETAQAGILTKIKYPTGGETSFTYESNTVTNDMVESQTKEMVINFGVSNQKISDVPSPYFSDELIIPAGGSQVQFAVTGLQNSLWWGCDAVHCYLFKDNNSTPFAEIGNNWDGSAVSLQPGAYRLKLAHECSVSSIANFSVIMKAQLTTAASTAGVKPVGGLRVKTIVDDPADGGQAIVKTYRYEMEKNALKSSGVLVNFPDYGYDLRMVATETNETGEVKGPGIGCNYRVRQSFSNYPLATTQGSYVGYSNVIVDQGDGESRYSFAAYGDVLVPTFPFAPMENEDWARGFLLSSKELVRKDGAWTLTKETVNVPTSFNRHKTYGIKTGRSLSESLNGEVLPYIQPIPKYVFYPVMTEFFGLGQTKERVYDQKDPSKFIETITTYNYSPQHLQLTQSNTLTSRSDNVSVEEMVINKKYPFDYVFTEVPSEPVAAGIKNLQDLHVVNPVVEEFVIKQNRNIVTGELSDQRVVEGQITNFKPGRPYPDQLLRLELKAPFALTDFGNGSLLIANRFSNNGNATISDLYKPTVIFNSYDEAGNIVTQQKAADLKRSYIWGYNFKYPVAEVVGADYASIVASSKLDQSILQNPSASDKEIMSEVDKIRTAFPAALVTTYTYQPMIGMTSRTDINNRSTYYEYDSFGRLIVVRDHDKNILKRLCYNYKGQPGNCVINVDTH